MLNSDDDWLAMVDAFSSAALEPGLWYSALEQLAAATGSQNGQLVALGPSADPSLSVWTAAPEVIEEFSLLGFNAPKTNPRVRAGNSARELTVLAEEDFITPDEMKVDESYKWGRSHGLAYICLSPLISSAEAVIGLAVCRDAKSGHIEPAQKRIYASLAPHARAAVRTQMLLENHRVDLLTGTMEAMSLAAFALDTAGRVIGHTAKAEALITDGKHLGWKRRRLEARVAPDSATLETAIQNAVAGLSRPGAPLLRSLFVRSPLPALAPLVLDVVPLPARAPFGHRCRALVLVRGLGHPGELAAGLELAYGLTPSEARVALHLAEGQTPEWIAEQRRITVATVRVHLRNCYEKLGISRQAELVARLRPLH